MTNKVIAALMSLTLAMGLVVPALAGARELPPPSAGAGVALSALDPAFAGVCIAALPTTGTPDEVAVFMAAGGAAVCDFGLIAGALGASAACVAAIVVGWPVLMNPATGWLAGSLLYRGLQAVCGGALVLIIAAIESCLSDDEQDTDMAAMIVSEGRLLVAVGV